MVRTLIRSGGLLALALVLAGCPQNGNGGNDGGADAGPPPCTTDTECVDTARGDHCWPATGTCYAKCTQDADCQDVNAGYCHKATGTCYEPCEDNDGCTALGTDLVCYPKPSMPDAGAALVAVGARCMPKCTQDDQCSGIVKGTRCETNTGLCVPAAGCLSNSTCTSQDPNDYCYQYGVQCRCVTEQNDTGMQGVCRRRKGPCQECTTNDECGSDFIFDPVGTCKALQGDTSGKKYCFQQKVGQCPCGMVDDGTGYCKPQSNTCDSVGCSADKDCQSGSVCNTQKCLCEPRCRWDFSKKELSPPGCPPGTTCWVDNANLDPLSLFYGAGRCRPPCSGDADCGLSTANPFGGPKLACRAETLSGGGTTDKRCRANGECMDDLECPKQPDTSVYLGYCDRSGFQCKTDCRTGTDPVTAQSYKDCRAPYACASDGGTNYCRLQTCVEQGGAAIACARGQYCCGEDKNGDGNADPCPPSSQRGPDDCYDAPRPPYCTTCESNADCLNVQVPAYLTGTGACANGSKSPSCSPLPPVCLYAGDRPTGGQGVNVCAPSTWNDGTRDSFGVGKDVKGCPTGYPAIYIYPQLVQSQDNYCDTDTDCNQGTTVGKCEPDPSQRLQDGGTRKACMCTVGNSVNQCPQNPDAGLQSYCKFGVNGQRVACIESVVCQTPPGNAYQAPGSPKYGCGL